MWLRGRWWAADLRPWGGGRPTLRNPSASGWPHAGDPYEGDDEEVARRWAWSYVDLHRDDARRRHLQLQPRPESLLVAVERYMGHLERTAAWRTVRARRGVLYNHLLPALGEREPWQAVDTQRLQSLLDALSDQGYARSTVEQYRIEMGGLFTWLGASPSPAAGVVLPETPDEDAVPWTDDELGQLRETADRVDADPKAARHDCRVLRRRWDSSGEWAAAGHTGRPPKTPAGLRLPSLRLAVELALGSGARLSELPVLQWTAIRERDRTIRITHQLGQRRDELAPLKGKRGRTTLLLPSWWEHHSRRSRGGILGLECSIGSSNRMQSWGQLLFDLAGINAPGRGWHTHRHTYARLYLELGGRLQELQKSLGHASIVTTEQSYGHLDQDTAAALAAGRIYGAPPRGPRLHRSGSTSGTTSA